jgi:hypothetical protein
MQVCKNLILALASFSTASILWTPPARPELTVNETFKH